MERGLLFDSSYTVTNLSFSDQYSNPRSVMVDRSCSFVRIFPFSTAESDVAEAPIVYTTNVFSGVVMFISNGSPYFVLPSWEVAYALTYEPSVWKS